MKFVLATIAVFAVSAAFADPKIQTADDRISNVIGQLSIQNAVLATQAEQLQAELAAAKARIKELEKPAPDAK